MDKIEARWIALSPINIEPIPGIFGAYSRWLNIGDALEVTGPEWDVRRAEGVLEQYPDLVAEGSPRHVEYLARLKAEAAERLAYRTEQERKAKEWIAEHDIPEYVVEWLRDEYDYGYDDEE
jgi:hypothetical protein